jgi:hypothetical protein
MDILKNIEADRYFTNAEYPKYPVKPPLLYRTEDKLAPEELQTLPQVRKEYDEAIARYRNIADAFDTEQERMDEIFKKDCFQVLGILDHYGDEEDVFMQLWKALEEMSYDVGIDPWTHEELYNNFSRLVDPVKTLLKNQK